MEEDDAEIGARVVRLDDVAAVHVGVAARLVDEQPAHVVEPLERVAALVEDRCAPKRIDTARHDAERLARRVVVDGPDLHRQTLLCARSELRSRGDSARAKTPSGP